MGIVFRQSIKTSIVVFTGAFLGVLIAWMSTKLILPQLYGYTNNLTRQALLMSQVCILGINSTLVVYIHKYTERDNRRHLLISLYLVIPLVFALLCSIPYYFLRPWVLHHFQPADVPLMDRYYLLLPVYGIIFILLTLLDQYLGSQMKVAVSAFLKEVVLRVINIILILLYGLEYISFDTLIISMVFMYLVPIVAYLIIAARTPGFRLSFRFSAFTREEYKELVHFSWYHFLLAMSMNLMTYLDALALPLYDHKGLSSVAVYGIAVVLISFLQLPNKAMMTPTITILSKAIANNDHEKARDAFVRSSINVLVATVFMAAIIISNLSNAIALLPHGYEPIGLIFILLFIGRFADLATGVNDAMLSITNHYKFNFYVSLGVIIILFGLIKWLVPLYGVYGAAIATSASLIMFNVAKFLYVWKKLDMQPFSQNTLLVLFAGSVTFCAGYFMPHFLAGKGHMYIYTFIDAAIRSLIVVAVYLLMLYWLKPSADLREYIATIRKNKRLF